MHRGCTRPAPQAHRRTGQVDIIHAPAPLDGRAGEAVLADKARDGNALHAATVDLGNEAVIPSHLCRKVAIPYDATTYRHRNRVERCFGKL